MGGGNFVLSTLLRVFSPRVSALRVEGKSEGEAEESRPTWL